MHKWKQKTANSAKLLIAALGLIVPILISQTSVAAPTYSSSNYGVDEVFMGAGGLNDASSASYRARASLGDTGVGNSSSNNYQAYGGFTTNADPYIEFLVTGGNIDLGYLRTDSTVTATGTFTLKAYLASGYAVHTVSHPPQVTGNPGTHQLATSSSPVASAIGTEQFGINLVANTSPTSFGADPVQLPDASYSFGQVDSNYSTPNVYKYTNGDRVAFSNSSTGTTQFTVSYIYNISDITPAGEYIFDQILVATATF